MTVGVEYVREICKENKIAVSVLEKECGFSNGYLNPKKACKIPYERALIILNYFQKYKVNADLNRILGVAIVDSVAFLNITADSEKSSGENTSHNRDSLTARDKRNIAKDLDRLMEEIVNDTDGPLYYNDQPISKNKIDLLRNAIEVALEDAKVKNKETYRPYKHKPRPKRD